MDKYSTISPVFQPFQATLFPNNTYMGVNNTDNDKKTISLNDKTAMMLGLLLAHFNQLTGRDCRYSKARFKLLKQWVREGYTQSDFELVTEYKYHQWKDDEKMKEHIELDTFWRGIHFEKYLEAAKNEKQQQKKQGIGNFFSNTGTYTR